MVSSKSNSRQQEAGPLEECRADVTSESDVFDCLACGRCCYQREGTILITEADVLKWRRLRRFDIVDGLGPGHFGQDAFQMSASTGACIHHGTPASEHACAIYPIRAEVCQSFQVGSPQCLEYRRSLVPVVARTSPRQPGEGSGR